MGTEEVRKKVPNINDNAKLQESNKIANDYTYKLSAVVTHKGYKSTETGHYVADILSPDENQWFRCDDLEVNKTTLSDVLEQSKEDGYIFIYSRSNSDISI